MLWYIWAARTVKNNLSNGRKKQTKPIFLTDLQAAIYTFAQKWFGVAQAQKGSLFRKNLN